jgi:hypothetical protein
MLNGIWTKDKYCLAGYNHAAGKPMFGKKTIVYMDIAFIAIVTLSHCTTALIFGL